MGVVLLILIGGSAMFKQLKRFWSYINWKGTCTFCHKELPRFCFVAGKIKFCTFYCLVNRIGYNEKCRFCDKRLQPSECGLPRPACLLFCDTECTYKELCREHELRKLGDL